MTPPDSDPPTVYYFIGNPALNSLSEVDGNTLLLNETVILMALVLCRYWRLKNLDEEEKEKEKKKPRRPKKRGSRGPGPG